MQEQGTTVSTMAGYGLSDYDEIFKVPIQIPWFFLTETQLNHKNGAMLLWKTCNRPILFAVGRIFECLKTQI